MIRITRVTKPRALVTNEINWLVKIREALHLLNNATTEAETKNAQKTLKKVLNKYKHEDIKETLAEQMFHGKCAYCEAKITHIDYGDIEHFRPKDTFPLLAVEWENLLLACRVCNGAEFKGTKFLLDTNNHPLLINPCTDEPNTHLDFEFDEITKFAIVVSKDEKGLESINTYGLNRDRSKDDLLQHRTKFVNYLIVLSSYYYQDQRAKELLDRACESSGEYAAFARMVNSKYVIHQDLPAL